jgi:hypothetical protein
MTFGLDHYPQATVEKRREKFTCMSAPQPLQQKASQLGPAAVLGFSVWQAGQLQSKKY